MLIPQRLNTSEMDLQQGDASSATYGSQTWRTFCEASEREEAPQHNFAISSARYANE